MPRNDTRPVIGFDVSSALGERTGIGHSAAQLLNALAEVWPDEWRLRAFVNSMRHPLPEADPWTSNERVEIKRTYIPGRYLLRSWKRYRWPAIETLMGPLDVYHSPASYVAPVRRANLIATVHDLYFLKHSENDEFGGSYFKATFPEGLKRCAKIIAISEYTKRQIVENYGIDPDKIAVVHLGADLEFFKPEGERVDVSKPFFLCVATIGPKRKNIDRLIEAYAQAKSSAAGFPRLILAGRAQDAEAEVKLNALLERERLKDDVHVTGYITNEELARLYRSAMAAIVPSLDEGFGLTAVEAMASGCPVIAANAGALPEVCGEAAVLVDPANTNEISRAMINLFADHDFRARLQALGLNRATQFTWQIAAQKMIAIYREFVTRSS